jgi:hypothetical protein
MGGRGMPPTLTLRPYLLESRICFRKHYVTAGEQVPEVDRQEIARTAACHTRRGRSVDWTRYIQVDVFGHEIFGKS